MAITYPLITVSTRAQVAAGEAKGGSKGLLKGIKKILQDEGPLGFYRGLSSALFGITVTNGVYYYWYEVAKTLFQKQGRNTSMSTLESMAAGALAGSATAVVTNPIWVINVRISSFLLPSETGTTAHSLGTRTNKVLLRFHFPTDSIDSKSRIAGGLTTLFKQRRGSAAEKHLRDFQGHCQE